MAYDANSIQIRDFRTAARTTPGMYIGADGQDATFNCFLEILNNACDEAIMGRGNKIIVEVEDNAMRISDAGAGVPRGKNKDTDEVLIEIYTSAHSSGKFDSTNYQRVRGMHGVGSSTVCVCSKVFDVWTRRDGGEWFLEFKDGIPSAPVAKKLRDTKETGTTIYFEPDKTIFHIDDATPAFDKERIKQELRLTSYFIPNVTFIYRADEREEQFISRNGLKDFAADNIKKPLHKQYIYGTKTFDGNIDIEVFAQWTSGHEKCYVFSNGALNSGGGTPVSGMKAAFTRTINEQSKETFDSEMIRKGLVTIINIKHPHPVYQNQVKDKIQNQELRGYTQTVFTEAIKDWIVKNPSDFNKIINLLLTDKKAEAAAEKARNAVLSSTNIIEKNQKKKVFASDKLKDAEFLGENSTLLVVEGLSAASSMAVARDIKKYGILALRGKLINCLSNNEDDIFNNEEINLLLSAMNIIPEHYNNKKLRYGKIAICVDSDSDGFHIGLLIMTAIYKLAPQFLQENRLYWLRSPLYIEKIGKQEKYYFTDEEIANVQIKGELQRNKGLGSLSAEQAKESMFNLKNQRMDLLTPNDYSLNLLMQLMGEDNSYRKKFIFENVDFSTIHE